MSKIVRFHPLTWVMDCDKKYSICHYNILSLLCIFDFVSTDIFKAQITTTNNFQILFTFFSTRKRMCQVQRYYIKTYICDFLFNGRSGKVDIVFFKHPFQGLTQPNVIFSYDSLIVFVCTEKKPFSIVLFNC